jgi:hypothetical protein
MTNVRLCRVHVDQLRHALCERQLGGLLPAATASGQVIPTEYACDPLTMALGHVLMHAVTMPIDMPQAAAIQRGCCVMCCLDGRRGFHADELLDHAAAWAADEYLSQITPGGTA